MGRLVLSVEAVASHGKEVGLLSTCLAGISEGLGDMRWKQHVTGVCAAGGASVIAIEMRWVWRCSAQVGGVTG